MTVPTSMLDDNSWIRTQRLAAILTLVGASCATSRPEPSPIARAATDPDDAAAIDSDAELLEIIRARFVDPIERELVVDADPRTLIAALPYHNVISLEPQLRDADEYETGDTGVLLEDDDAGIYVASILQFSPADAADLAIGDRLLAVDGRAVVGHHSDSLQDYLHGEAGSTVELIVASPGDRRTRRVRLLREPLAPASIHFERANPFVGYIRVSWFGRETLLHFAQAIERLRAVGTRAFVLDLRSNRGGAVNVAVRLADRLLPEGSLIVERVSRHSERQARDVAGGGSRKMLAPIAVLIDGETASAAELFVAALQDNGRTELFADAEVEQTIGKGTGQFEYPLPKSGLVVKITEELYRRPNGGDIEDLGVRPDRRIEVTPEARSALDWHGLPSVTTHSLADRPFEDPVLDAAISSLDDLVRSPRD